MSSPSRRAFLLGASATALSSAANAHNNAGLVTPPEAPPAVSLTLETAWNTPDSSTDGYRTVGAQLGMAIEKYLRTDPTK